MKSFPKFVLVMGALSATQVFAQSSASVPYTPSWSVRHHLALLVDHAGLALPLSHWPLPAAAVSSALADLPTVLTDPALEFARTEVQRELKQRGDQGQVSLQLRERSDGLTGFDENYTPGSSVQVMSSEGRWQSGDVTVAGRLGVRMEDSSNSLAAGASGVGTDGRYQARLDGSSAVVAWGGWNLQAFSHRNWWGTGWQSSLVNGHNAPAWNGVGIQRGTVKASESPLFSWMGPWNLDLFVARAQDPLVSNQQPRGFLFSGGRLTMQPQPWLELGFSRGLQTAGDGRPSGVKNFAKAFLGQEVNQNPGDPPDTSNQLAGYDVRVRCPKDWGGCAVYTQWMGEDAAGQYPPLPYRFMKMVGFESSYGEGRYRVFAEYTDTNVPRLIGEGKEAGYQNYYYPQGYTNGGRWIGSAQGGGSKVTTLGWMDAQNQRMVKVHAGTVLWSLGSGYPGANAQRGQLRGLSASQTVQWSGLTWTPELSWLRLSEGTDSGKRNNLRVGLMAQMLL